ncbi:MAG: hypothetical protein V7711_09360 [Pseudomonadales bacterium]
MNWETWAVYLLAVGALAVVWWRLTGKMQDGWIRRLLRLFVAIPLFTPAYSMLDHSAMAPAYIVAIFGGLLGEDEILSLGVRPLLVALALGFTVVSITTFVQSRTATKSSVATRTEPGMARTENTDQQIPEA